MKKFIASGVTDVMGKGPPPIRNSTGEAIEEGQDRALLGLVEAGRHQAPELCADHRKRDHREPMIARDPDQDENFLRCGEDQPRTSPTVAQDLRPAACEMNSSIGWPREHRHLPPRRPAHRPGSAADAQLRQVLRISGATMLFDRVCPCSIDCDDPGAGRLGAMAPVPGAKLQLGGSNGASARVATRRRPACRRLVFGRTAPWRAPLSRRASVCCTPFPRPALRCPRCSSSILSGRGRGRDRRPKCVLQRAHPAFLGLLWHYA